MRRKELESSWGEGEESKSAKWGLQVPIECPVLQRIAQISVVIIDSGESASPFIKFDLVVCTFFICM